MNIFQPTITGSVNITGSLNVVGPISASSFTGSLLGTASYAQINVSAGTTSNNMSAVVFSNANNISFGLNGSTVTATYQPAVQSYYENMPLLANSSFAAFFGGSSQLVQPFIIPYDISVSYLRVLLSNSFNSTTFGTTANASYTLNQSVTYYANIYSLGAGSNSSVLQHMAQALTGQTFQIRAEVGAASNNQTVSHNMTYPGYGGAASQYATNYNVNAASAQISTTHLTQFNAGRALDIPFATSLPAGEYWIAFQRSTATATTGGQLSNITMAQSILGVSQVNSVFGAQGGASNNPSGSLNLFHGSWTTNVNGSTTSTIVSSQIQSAGSQFKAYFAAIRIA